MTGERIWLFDTTLRDGGQTRGVDFTVSDKQFIVSALDDFGIDYIEGGWPGLIRPMMHYSQKPRISAMRHLLPLG